MPSSVGGGGDLDGWGVCAGGGRPKCVEGPGAITPGEGVLVARSFTEKPKVSNSMGEELSVVN
jgi:hypothetical protein